ncbi:hypothetical protein K7432_008856 [Basidiobolus ranarum]|uniref:Uncharacterized protein n=1 Tax=Basidiobolus ranarum TaxID=34480 RepID=A0ABR2VYB9_9FUNG
MPGPLKTTCTAESIHSHSHFQTFYSLEPALPPRPNREALPTMEEFKGLTEEEQFDTLYDSLFVILDKYKDMVRQTTTLSQK